MSAPGFDPTEYAPEDDLCSECGGAGEIVACVNDGPTGCSHANDYVYRCQDCAGSGYRPQRLMLRPVDGAGTWPYAPAPVSSLRSQATAAVLILIGITLWIGLVVAGRAVMCATHADALSYCTSVPR